MIKTFLGIAIFTSVVPVLLSFAIEPLLTLRGEIYYQFSSFMTFESLSALGGFLALMVFYSLYKLFIH